MSETISRPANVFQRESDKTNMNVCVRTGNFGSSDARLKTGNTFDTKQIIKLAEVQSHCSSAGSILLVEEKKLI